MLRLRIAALFLLMATPLFAGFRVLTAEPRGAAPGALALVHLRSNGDVYFDTLPTLVKFGNALGTPFQVVNNMEIAVIAPAHAPGFVTVTINLHGQEYSTIEQFGYGMTEKVLVPIAADLVPGANGTRWSTELWVRNDADHAVPIDPEYCSFIGSWHPCSEPVTRIAANSTVQLTGRGDAQYPYALLFPPLQDADSLHYSIVVRELSTGQMAAVPAVRDRDRRTGRTVFPAVPNDAGHRAALRLYSGANTITVSIVDSATGTVLEARTIRQFFPTDFDTSLTLVSVADLFVTPELRGHERLDVIIDTLPYDRYWALLTLTDNATQQVTVFTP
ncbi:MAG TPA: hypothetical protein VG323_18405 [Thermoanaerobaculia bacterium]|nr:hypothetical protein [Thermoanaerobaculia bacterium]